MATRDSAPPAAPHPADEQQQPRRNLPVPTPAPTVPVAPGETSSSAIAAREKAAIEARFLYAMANPRNCDDARVRLLKSCQRPRFAKEARYNKPIGTEKVHGLSIRFAEEARICWRNVDVTSMLVFDDDDRRIYRVVGIDLEANATDSVDVLVEKFVERKFVRQGMEVIGHRANTKGEIVYKVRATDDDLFVKANNLIAKARRNVILTLLPADIKEECEEEILKTMAERDRKDPDGARKEIIDAFFKFGVTPTQLVELLGHPLEQINPAELTLLRSYYTALKDGEATWADIFEAHTRKPASAQEGSAAATSSAPARGTEPLRDGLKAKAQKANGGEKAPEPVKSAAPASPPGQPPLAEQARAAEHCHECGAELPKHKQNCWYTLHSERQR